MNSASPKDSAATTLGKTIRGARQARGLSLRDVAEVLEINHVSLGEIELDRRIPSEKLLRRIAEELRLDADELRARAGKLTEEEVGYLKRNPSALKLLIAMMEAGFGPKETERLVRHVGKRR